MGICLNKTGVSFLVGSNLMLKSIRTSKCPMTSTLSSYSINQLHFTVTAPKSNAYYGYSQKVVPTLTRLDQSEAIIIFLF